MVKMLVKILGTLLLFTAGYSQNFHRRTYENTYFIDADGDTNQTMNDDGELIVGGITSNDLSGNQGLVSGKTINIVSGTTNASVIGLSVAGGGANVFSSVTGTGTLLPLKFFLGANEYVRIETTGWLDRREVWPTDAIAWYPPADSGAVLDTLTNSIEVLQFYHNTDSVNVTNSWQMPDWADQIDSMKIYVEAPNTSGDSSAFAVEIEAYGIGEARTGTLTAVGADTVDLGTTSSEIIEFLITGFTGISANDIIDFRIYRDTTISNNVAAAVTLRRVRVYYQ